MHGGVASRPLPLEGRCRDRRSAPMSLPAFLWVDLLMAPERGW
jgi:hypothetical protein